MGFEGADSQRIDRFGAGKSRLPNCGGWRFTFGFGKPFAEEAACTGISCEKAVYDTVFYCSRFIFLHSFIWGVWGGV